MNRATALSSPIALAYALARGLALAVAFGLPLAVQAQSAQSAPPSGSPADNRARAGLNADTAASAETDDQAFQQWVNAQRQRIAAGRAAAHARYDADRRDCWQRFAVNACLDAARDRRRATTDALRHDELRINAQQRDRRTAARLRELAQKQARPQTGSTDGAARNQTPADAPASSPSGADDARAPR